jgi:ABC-type transport system involved in multi-copper enzyme maturation permease subunit
LLAKPVRRHELILGKYLGLLLTLFINLSIMTVGLELALLYNGKMGLAGHLRILPAAYMVFLALALTTALALLFSTFSTPALSAVFTFFIWVAGHFGRDLLGFGELTKTASVKWICNILYYAIPNFSNFSSIDSRSIIQSIGYSKPIDAMAIAGATIYCILYCSVLLSLSVLIFMRRDFK